MGPRAGKSRANPNRTRSTANDRDRAISMESPGHRSSLSNVYEPVPAPSGNRSKFRADRHVAWVCADGSLSFIGNALPGDSLSWFRSPFNQSTRQREASRQCCLRKAPGRRAGNHARNRPEGIATRAGIVLGILGLRVRAADPYREEECVYCCRKRSHNQDGSQRAAERAAE